MAVILAWTVNPVLWLCTIGSTGFGSDCTARPGFSDELPAGCPQEGLSGLASVAMLAVWVLGSTVAALGLGIAEGRYRRFANGHVVAAAAVAVGAPWAMLAYAVGNGLGRLLSRGSDA